MYYAGGQKDDEWKPNRQHGRYGDYRPDWTTRIISLISLIAGLVALLMSIFA